MTTTLPGTATALLQLPVPYFSQRDSRSGQAERMCFSSSCAMAAAQLQPGCLGGGDQADDTYLQLVNRHGDSTDAAAQLAALRQLGLRASFRQDGDAATLIAQLQRGVAVPVGWLHRGPVTAPSGGGHWSVVVGWDGAQRDWLMHDPYGEADLLAGGFCRTSPGSGRAQRYSDRHWGPRWQVEGAGTGWWIALGD